MTSPLDDLATPGQLATPTAADKIAEASDAIRGECGWHIYPSLDMEWRRDGSGTGVLLLPTTLLTAVTSVTSDGQPVDDFDWSPDGIIELPHGRRFSRRLGGVVVTGSAGFDEAPRELRMVTLALASRLLAAPDSRISRTVGGTTTAWSPGDGVAGFTRAERRILARYTPKAGA